MIFIINHNEELRKRNMFGDVLFCTVQYCFELHLPSSDFIWKPFSRLIYWVVFEVYNF